MADRSSLSGVLLPTDETDGTGSPRLNQTKFVNRVVAASVQAVARDYIKANASTAPVVLTPPAAPVLNDVVAFMKTDASPNAVTFNATVNGDPTGVVATTQWAGGTVFYNGTSWELMSVNVTNSGVTSTDLQNALATKASSVEYDPFDLLNTNKLFMTKVENVTSTGGSEQTLLGTTTGPGIVESIWMAVGGNPALDGRLRVYYDGSATPTIDIDIGSLFATHYSAVGSMYTPNMSINVGNTTNFATGFLFKFKMPFGTSIRITYYNPTNVSISMYSMVTYRKTSVDYANGRRLRYAGARYADQAITRTAGATTTLATITGGPGWIVWHSQVGGVNATDLSWMERNFRIVVDGESTPSIEATGTEDWFDSAWYFNTWSDRNLSQFSYVGTDRPGGNYIVGMATDLAAKWGGIPFNTSAVMTALPEAACLTGDTFCYAVLYYS